MKRFLQIFSSESIRVPNCNTTQNSVFLLHCQYTWVLLETLWPFLFLDQRFLVCMFRNTIFCMVLQFVDYSFLSLSSLSCFHNSCQCVRPCMIWTWCRCNSRQSPTPPHTQTRLLESFWMSFRSITLILWNLSTNLTDFCSRRHPNSHTFVFLVQSPDLQKLTWWHQYNLVNRIWFFSRHVQWNFSVQHDDDKWNSFRASAWAQKSFLIPSSSFASSSWNPSLSPDSPWSSPLRFSLSSRWIPVPEWVLGIRSFSLIILLNHLLQEIQIHHLFGLSGLLSHSVFWNIFWCTKFPYFIDHLFSNSPMSVIGISFSEIPPRMMHNQ